MLKKLFILSLFAVLFCLQTLACGEQKSQATAPASAKTECPAHSASAGTNVVLASNEVKSGGSCSMNGCCNTTRVMASLFLGLGLVFGTTMVAGKLKI